MIMISKTELEFLALTMMRNHPVCADLRTIRIEADTSGNWTVMPANANQTFSAEISRVARKAELNLRPVYGIILDPRF